MTDLNRRKSILAALAVLALATGTCLPRDVHAQPEGYEPEVVMAMFGGSIEQFVRAELVPAFEKTTGIKVKVVVGTALSELREDRGVARQPGHRCLLGERAHARGRQAAGSQ